MLAVQLTCLRSVIDPSHSSCRSFETVHKNKIWPSNGKGARMISSFTKVAMIRACNETAFSPNMISDWRIDDLLGRLEVKRRRCGYVLCNQRLGENVDMELI